MPSHSRSKVAARFTLWSIVILFTGACDNPGCGIRSSGVNDSDDGADIVPQSSSDEDLQKEESASLVAIGGRVSAKQQIETLWGQTVKQIHDDLKQTMSDEAYLSRRDPVLTPWFTAYFSHREQFQHAGLESTEIIGLINQVYGDSTDPQGLARREKQRSDLEGIEAKIAIIQEKVNKFP